MTSMGDDVAAKRLYIKRKEEKQIRKKEGKL
jgi:hypothetical protein